MNWLRLKYESVCVRMYLCLIIVKGEAKGVQEVAFDGGESFEL